MSSRKIKGFEQLEQRDLLVIDWVNQGAIGNDSDNFQNTFGLEDAVIARAIVEHAIDDWQRVIPSFNYNDPGLNDTYQLTVTAGPDFNSNVAGRGGPNSFNFTVGEKPSSGSINMDDNGGGEGWFFDQTPTDDAEFSGLLSPYSANFVDASVSTSGFDFYRIITHEIGHALGIANTGALSGSESNLLTEVVGTDQVNNTSQLTEFLNPNGFYYLQEGFTATLTGGAHLYEGPPDPTEPDHQDIATHPDNLMNSGRPSELGRPDIERRLIDDDAVKLLADAYGYDVILPSELDSMHATLDAQTGTLLVQGLPDVDGVTINLQYKNEPFLGPCVEVKVNNMTELFPIDDVKKIVILEAGDNVTVDPTFQSITQLVDYVVSTNEDSADYGTLVNGFYDIDIDPATPGKQVPVRAAVRAADATSAAETRKVYVPRGNYTLSLGGSGGVTQGDLDITGDVAVLGAGAGATVLDIDDALNSTRHFEVQSTGKLQLERMTLTGGDDYYGASINVAPNNTHASGMALTLDEVAVVNNGVAGVGGAIHVGNSSEAEILGSVITNDTALWTGAGVYAESNSTVTLEESIVAKNSTVYGVHKDIAAASGATIVSNGNNLIGTGSDFTPHANGSDLVGDADHVVTSVADTFEVGDNPYHLSLREAIGLANQTSSTSEIWMPGWNYLLTRDRLTYGGGSATDTLIDWGDLDIQESLTLRSAGQSTVGWSTSVEQDEVFDRWGDFDDNGPGNPHGNGVVDGADQLEWSRQANTVGTWQHNSSADADDDGDVDGDDLALWNNSSGNLYALDTDIQVL